MTQPEMAVGGSSDTVVAAEPTLEDRLSAAFDEQPKEDEETPGDPPPATDSGEPEDAAEPEAEIEVTDDDLEPIAPPVSWTAEEKAEFAELPRALQETLTRRESEREKFVQTKAQEAKQVKSAIEREAMEAIGRVENAHVQQLQALLPEIPARPSASLMASNPQAYAYQLEVHENAIAQHRYVQQIAAQVNERLSGLEKEAQAQQAREDAEILSEKFPEYLDDGKKPELRRELQSTLRAIGYPEDQIDEASAADILALRAVSQLKAKADKYDTLMARQMEKVREAKTLPKVSRPGVSQGKGAAENQRYIADRQAMRNGDKDAAARAFSRFL